MPSTTLAGVDGRSGGRDAIALAAQLTPPGGRLVLAGVWLSSHLLTFTTYPDEAAAACRATLESERARAGLEAELVDRGTTSVARGLHELAVDEGADVLVLGSSGRASPGRVLLGDDVRSALHQAPCAVAVAPRGWAGSARPLARVGVAWHAADDATPALETARAIATTSGATLAAMTVVRHLTGPTAPGPFAVADPAWEDVVDRELGEARRRLEGLGVDVPRAVVGAPVEELRAFSEDLDLLVVGSRGYGPVRRLVLGSTSDGLLRDAACPVLVVPRPAGAPGVSAEAAASVAAPASAAR